MHKSVVGAGFTPARAPKSAGSSSQTADIKDRRRPELDGLRGIAVLLVVYHHWMPMTLNISGNSVAGRLGALSWSGVDLFFVLSGFLIGGILLDHKNSPSYFKTFYIRRVCRILPLYVLCVALFYITKSSGWLWNSPLPWYSYATFTQNFWSALRGNSPEALWLVPTWSLAVEEQFYLTLPLLLYLTDSRKVPYLSALVIISAIAVRSAFCFTSGFASSADYVLLPCRADALMLGVLAAWCQRNGVHLSRKTLYTASIILGGGFIALSWFAPDRTNPVMMTVGYTLIALFYLAVLLTATQGGFRLVRNRALRLAGVAAYFIYLFHLPIIGTLRGQESSAIVDPGMTLISLPVLFFLAWLSWKYFEKPFLDWGHRWKYEHDAVDNALASSRTVR